MRKSVMLSQQWRKRDRQGNIQATGLTPQITQNSVSSSATKTGTIYLRTPLSKSSYQIKT